MGDVPRPRADPRLGRLAGGPAAAARARPRPARRTRYILYPHKPIVAYLPQTRELLSEYCVDFPDETRPYGSPHLPDSDDVLAKWMALTGDERAPDRDGQHAPRRAARSTPSGCAATSGACRSGSASGSAAQRAPAADREAALARPPAGRVGEAEPMAVEPSGAGLLSGA